MRRNDTTPRRQHHAIPAAVRETRLNFQGAGGLLPFYEEGLQGYTYLEDVRNGY